MLRDAGGRPVRIIGIVRDATAELAQLTALRKLETARAHQATIVQRTTEALSRAVTVDDVTASLTGAGALERLGADGLALGLVENDAIKIIALSGESLEILSERQFTRLDGSLPLSHAVVTREARFVTSLTDLAAEFPLLADYLARIPYDAAAYLPLIAQAKAIGGLVLFYRRRSEFSPEERNLCLGLATASWPSRSSGPCSSTRSGSSPPASRPRCCPAASPGSAAGRSPCATTRPGAGARSAGTGTT